MIDWPVVLSACAVALSLLFGFANWKRGNTQDTKQDAGQLTTVIVKLENIKDGISEIKSDMKNVKSDIQELRERTARNESSIAAFHSRLDDVTKGKVEKA